jgi:endogenous inhibitor of DNA gyrase (YacG/DUF329 family)
MPTIRTEIDVDFEVWCGICGKGVCYYTDVKDKDLTVTCPECEENIKSLKNEIKLLKRQIRDMKVKKVAVKRK